MLSHAEEIIGTFTESFPWLTEGDIEISEPKKDYRCSCSSDIYTNGEVFKKGSYDLIRGYTYAVVLGRDCKGKINHVDVSAKDIDECKGILDSDVLALLA